MQIDIQQIAADHIKSLEDQGIIKKTIQDSIEKTVIKGITDALESYKLRSTIEEKVQDQVSLIAAEVGFTAYNGFIAEKLKQITESLFNQDIADKIQQTFNDMLIIKRDSIKLSEICEAYRDWICEYVDESEKYDLQNFHVSIKEDGGFHWLNIDLAKEEPKRYSSDRNQIRFTVHRNNKDKYTDKNTGWISSVYIDGYGIDKTLNFGHMTSIEKLLINISYNKTPIEIDVESEDDVDSSFDIDI
jgi:DNA-binding HxlR family transcriptional regulator